MKRLRIPLLFRPPQIGLTDSDPVLAIRIAENTAETTPPNGSPFIAVLSFPPPLVVSCSHRQAASLLPPSTPSQEARWCDADHRSLHRSRWLIRTRASRASLLLSHLPGLLCFCLTNIRFFNWVFIWLQSLITPLTPSKPCHESPHHSRRSQAGRIKESRHDLCSNPQGQSVRHKTRPN